MHNEPNDASVIRRGIFIEKIWPGIVSHQALPWILVFAFGLRLWWCLEFNTLPTSDFKIYYDNAVRFVSGQSFIINSSEPKSAFWPVGWPFFLSVPFTLFGPSLLLAKIVGILCYLGTISLTYFLAFRATESRLSAGFSAFLLAIYPNHVAFSTVVASEHLFVMLLLLSIAVYLGKTGQHQGRHNLYLVVAGAILGAATLVRAHTLYAPVLLSILVPGLWMVRGEGGARELLLKNSRVAIRRIALMYAGLFIVLAPWVIRNYAAFGKVVLVSTNTGYNLLIGSDPDRHMDWQKMTTKYSAIYKAGFNEAQRDALAKKQAILNIRRDPSAYLRLCPSKLKDCFMIDHDGFWYSRQSLSQQPYWSYSRISEPKVDFLERLTGLNFIFYVYLAVLGIVGSIGAICSKRVDARRLGWVSVGFSLYFTLFVIIFFGQVRFHYPMMILAALMSAVTAKMFMAVSQRITAACFGQN